MSLSISLLINTIINKRQSWTTLLLAFLAAPSFSQTYECRDDAELNSERAFSAAIRIDSQGTDLVKATLATIALSEPWPLAANCDAPVAGMSLSGHQRDDEIVLGPVIDNDCGFTIYLSTLTAPTDGESTDSESSIYDAPWGTLAPRQSYKEWGERPYQARCAVVESLE
uniref:hypothetical protein n=1 Tax=Thaumasiovibrio occultus TaxID=1891184 RepID=UPI00131C1C54|nr:hypothetical protein [Thaumasiovibrio occultus]